MTHPVETSGIYDIHDDRFRTLVVASAGLDRLVTGLRWAEGPVWFNDLNCLLVSDIPNDRIIRWVPDALGEGATSVFRAPAHFTNGNSRDRQGRLISCEHGRRQVTRTEADGSVTVLADSYQGKRLNSPNDLVCHSDGSVWFTDPTYGIMSDYEGHRATPEQPNRNVYRIDPSGKIDVVVDDFTQPNGLAFSPDEKTLYIADSAFSHDPQFPRHIRAFAADAGRLSRDRVFAQIDIGLPDGIRTDIFGNLWSSGGDGVSCFAPDGTLLGKIRVPETVANLSFGGPRRNRLFIAATTTVYAVYLATNGAQIP